MKPFTSSPSAPRRVGRLLAGLAAMVAATGCATAPVDPPHPDFTGVWSGAFTTPEDPYWQVEDFVCFAGCPDFMRRFITDWLDDPANDDRPFDDIGADLPPLLFSQFSAISTPEGLKLLEAYNAGNDPALRCEPDGLARDATNPMPMVVRQEGDDLVIEYEKWRHVRTIHMDGRGHPADLEPTLLGHSIGRYEGGVLVVETVGVEAYPYQASIGGYSDQATFMERYEVLENPRRLTLTMTVTDPVTLLEPLVVFKTWLPTPDVELFPYDCFDIVGVP